MVSHLIPVGFVDGSLNLELKRRFKVNFGDEPAVIRVQNNHYYKMPKSLAHTTSDYASFATVGFIEAVDQGEIPKQLGIWDELAAMWRIQVDNKGGALNVLLMKNEDGEIHYFALAFFIIWPLTSIYILYKIVRSACQELQPEEEQEGES